MNVQFSIGTIGLNTLDSYPRLRFDIFVWTCKGLPSTAYNHYILYAIEFLFHVVHIALECQ